MDQLIFLFLDGVGIGRADQTNPFYLSGSQYLPFYGKTPCLPDGTPFKAIDARCGLPGIPQSASGQTAMFTGVSGKKLAPRPVNGYPNRQLRQILKRNNLFLQLRQQGARCRFLNAYPYWASRFGPQLVSIDEEGRLHFADSFPPQWRKRISVTTCLLIVNGEMPLNEEDLKRENALFQDYSNQSLIAQGFALPSFSPEKAAEIIQRVSRRHEVTLYEYFQTDVYGHRRPLANCLMLIRDLDRLLNRLLSLLDDKRDTLLLTSDHGNLEDKAQKGHTLNPVPLLAWGKHGERLRRRIRSIADVTPAVTELFSG